MDKDSTKEEKEFAREQVLGLMHRLTIPDPTDQLISATDILKSSGFVTSEKVCLRDFALDARTYYGLSSSYKVKELRNNVPFFLYYCKVNHGIRYSSWDKADPLLYILMGTTAYLDCIGYAADQLMQCDMHDVELTATDRVSMKNILTQLRLDPDKVQPALLKEPFSDYYAKLTIEIKNRERTELGEGADVWEESNQMDGRFYYIPTKLCTRQFVYVLKTVFNARNRRTEFSDKKYIKGMIFDLHNWDNEDIISFSSNKKEVEINAINAINEQELW